MTWDVIYRLTVNANSVSIGLTTGGINPAHQNGKQTTQWRTMNELRRL